MLRFERFQPSFQEAALTLINHNMRQRFGFLDESLNPDLFNIAETYRDEDFWVLFDEEDAVATGGLISYSASEGQIVRMHAVSSRRRIGLGSLMLEKLEERARERGFSKLWLETNLDWLDAIQFYQKNGYTEQVRNEHGIRFTKHL